MKWGRGWGGGETGPHCTLGLALCSLDSVCYSGTKSLPVSANSVVAVAFVDRRCLLSPGLCHHRGV